MSPVQDRGTLFLVFPMQNCLYCWPQILILLATTALLGSWGGSAPLWVCLFSWEITRGSVAKTEVTTAVTVVNLFAVPLLSCCLSHHPLVSREAASPQLIGRTEGKSKKRQDSQGKSDLFSLQNACPHCPGCCLSAVCGRWELLHWKLLFVSLCRVPGSLSSLLLLLIQDWAAVDITVPTFGASQTVNGIASMTLRFAR